MRARNHLSRKSITFTEKTVVLQPSFLSDAVFRLFWQLARVCRPDGRDQNWLSCLHIMNYGTDIITIDLFNKNPFKWIMRWAIVCHVGQSILKFIGHSIVVHNSCLSNICQKINRLPFRKGTATLEGILPIIQCAQSIPVHISPSNALLMFFPRVQSIFQFAAEMLPPERKKNNKTN